MIWHCARFAITWRSVPRAHVLFCWIAYAMYWVLERTPSINGVDR